MSFPRIRLRRSGEREYYVRRFELNPQIKWFRIYLWTRRHNRKRTRVRTAHSASSAASPAATSAVLRAGRKRRKTKSRRSTSLSFSSTEQPCNEIGQTKDLTHPLSQTNPIQDNISGFLLLFRTVSIIFSGRIRPEGVFLQHMPDPFPVTGNFTIGKQAGDYYDDEDDCKVFHDRKIRYSILSS